MDKDDREYLDNEERQLVSDFERTVLQGKHQFFDIDELETIIDYYMEVNDREPLYRAVEYGENLYPDSTEMRLRRAHLLLTEGHNEEALRMILDLQRREPGNTDVAYSLGVAYGAMNEHEKAIECYFKAMDDGWELGQIYANIAEEYYKMKRYDEALHYYLLTLDQDPTDRSTLLNFQDTCIEANRPEEAEHHLKQIVEDDPYNAYAWICLGRTQGAMGKVDDALRSYDLAATIEPHMYEAFAEKGQMLEAMGRMEEALNTYRQAAEQCDDKVYFYSSIVAVHISMGNQAAAEDYMRKLYELEPDNCGLLAFLSVNYLSMGNFEEASRLVTRGLQLEPSNARLLGAAGFLFDAMGQYSHAEESFNRMLDTGEYLEQDFALYLRFLYGQQRYSDLILQLQDIVDKEEGNEYFLSLLAAAYYRTNHYNSASHILPQCNRGWLSELCPEIFENALMKPFLPHE